MNKKLFCIMKKKLLTSLKLISFEVKLLKIFFKLCTLMKN